MISRVLGFPRVINEKAARTVAAVVALAGVIALATGAHWLLVPLAYGFWARVLAGPLEAALGLCIGCRIFALLIRTGVVPETVCLECADISARLQRV